MPNEIIAALIGAFLVLCGGLITIIWQASAINSKVDNHGDILSDHIEKDERRDEEVFARLNQHGEEIAGLKVGSGMHLERRPPTGGHRQINAGE